MIQENLKKFVAIAAANGYPVAMPKVIIKNLGRAAGRCCPTHIELDAQYLAHDEEETAFHTLGHEFAHWIQYQHKLFRKSGRGWEYHDSTFKALCRMLGVKEDTHHHMEVEGKRKLKRYTLTCGACQKEYKVTKIIIKRMSTGARGYACHCGEPLFVDNLETV
jgi:predicted SprT family Zn-dependent metalloprotease